MTKYACKILNLSALIKLIKKDIILYYLKNFNTRLPQNHLHYNNNNNKCINNTFNLHCTILCKYNTTNSLTGYCTSSADVFQLTLPDIMIIYFDYYTL